MKFLKCTIPTLSLLALIASASSWASDKDQRVEQLIKELKNPDENVRYQAAEALREIGPEAKGAVPTLISILKDPALKARGSSVRYVSAEALGEIGGPAANAAIPVLKAMQQDRNERSDIQGVAWGALMKIYLNDPDPKVRAKTTQNLGMTGPWAIPYLKEMLKDQNNTVRKAAEEALMSQHVQELAFKLNSGDPDSVVQALDALGNIGPPAKQYRLMVAQKLKHPDERVRKAAAEAMSKIGGK